MDYQDQLLSKNGIAIINLAKVLLCFDIGQRTPTVTELCEQLNLSRGTVQNALKTLQTNDAVRIESKGHLGSYIVKKNTQILLQYAGITALVGAMPLPYSKKYEGLASGLVTAMENNYNIPITMSYMRGAKNRIAMVLAHRYDFAVVSKYAALEQINQGRPILIIKDFGPYSYCSAHVVIFHDPKAKTIKDGMRVGIDSDSIDQSDMTKRACRGRSVKYYPVEYSSLLKRVISGDLDATVWNQDEITDTLAKVNYTEIAMDNVLDTEAVIVVNSGAKEIASLLSEVINTEAVLKIQKLVMEGKVTPSY
jgi:biotin operon repressor